MTSVIINRMDSGKNMNNKIALMITASVGFLTMQTSSNLVLLNSIKDAYLNVLGSDLQISSENLNSTIKSLNEVPMADYLDKLVIEDDPLVLGYTFYTEHIANICKECDEESHLTDLSEFSDSEVKIYALG